MKKIYIISVCIITLSIGIYLVFFGTNPIWDIRYDVSENPTPKTYEELRIANTEVARQDAEYYNSAIHDGNEASCEGITDTTKKLECRDMVRAGQAKQTGTITACDTLTASGVAILCRDAIFNDQAIASVDRSLCTNIIGSDRQSYCIELVDEKALRTAIESKNVTKSFCDGLSEKYQTTCLAEIREVNDTGLYTRAIENNDASLCQSITNTETRDLCSDTISLKFAISTGDVELCARLINTDKRAYCESQVSKTSDITLYKNATTALDLNSCSKINNTNLRNKCNDTIIINRVKTEQNTTFCEELTNTGLITACRSITN